MNNNYEGHDLKGTILRLERSSIYDGDGYRTVVFMKGLPAPLPVVFHTRKPKL